METTWGKTLVELTCTIDLYKYQSTPYKRMFVVDGIIYLMFHSQQVLQQVYDNYIQL